MSRPLVSVVTVNFNGRPHLECLLESAHAQTYPADRLEIIVVDNGSVDGSVEYVRTRYPTVKLVANDSNLGFARANNQGAAEARGHYLALLNNDMRLEASWLDRMVSCLEASEPDVVCAGSTILNWDGSLIDFGGATLAFNGVGFQARAHDPVESGVPTGPVELPFACGGALLVERDVYREVGGFDEDYFAYLEDVDFGWRLWVLGFRVLYCPAAVAYHRHNATSSQFDTHRKAVLIERNALYSMIKNYDDASLSAFLAPSLLLAFKRVALRSGIPRSEYSFSLSQLPAAVARTPAPSDESSMRAFARVWREEGGREALARTARRGVRLANRAVATLRRPSASEPVQANGTTRPIGREAYATVVALEDLIDHLPALMSKREVIQSARRRSDAEVFRVFGTPLEPAPQARKSRPAYGSAHEAVVKAFGVAERFQPNDQSGAAGAAASLEQTLT